ncbi:MULTISPECIES: hypothetical protein [Escherichia]
MLAYHFLDTEEVNASLPNHPVRHSQVSTGNDCAWHLARRRFYISSGTTDFANNHSRKSCKCG